MLDPATLPALSCECLCTSTYKYTHGFLQVSILRCLRNSCWPTLPSDFCYSPEFGVVCKQLLHLWGTERLGCFSDKRVMAPGVLAFSLNSRLGRFCLKKLHRLQLGLTIWVGLQSSRDAVSRSVSRSGIPGTLQMGSLATKANWFLSLLSSQISRSCNRKQSVQRRGMEID